MLINLELWTFYIRSGTKRKPDAGAGEGPKRRKTDKLLLLEQSMLELEGDVARNEKKMFSEMETITDRKN